MLPLQYLDVFLLIAKERRVSWDVIKFGLHLFFFADQGRNPSSDTVLLERLPKRVVLFSCTSVLHAVGDAEYESSQSAGAISQLTPSIHVPVVGSPHLIFFA